jgi:outer membrane protein OmpA-like peptidoglycan-associated protein
MPDIVTAIVGAGLLLGMPGTGMAQTRLGGQRFTPAGSEDGVLETEGADQRTPLWPYVGLWVNYALDPVVLQDNGEETGKVVEHLLAADLVASLNVWEGLELGFSLPVTFVATGEDTAATMAAIPEAPGLSLGDVVLRAGYRIPLSYRTSLALHVPVLLPSSQDDNVLGLGFGVRPTLAFVVGFESFDLVFNGSYLFREGTEVLDYEGGDELGLRAAGRIGLDGRWDTALLVDLGLTAATGDFLAAATTPAEGRLGVEHWFDRHWRLSGFAGTGLSTGVGAPDLRVGVGLTFGDKPRRPRIAPLPGDRDADGVMDADDQCPNDPEDADGFEDEDGCPDEDNDSDGILDGEDQCPNEPESPDGILDEDGCPDKIRVEGTRITTFEPVHFRTDSDEILPRSHAMLREVALVMKANTSMKIRVEGHTDATGDDDHNSELSERRAASVKRFLISQGVDESRIEAEGLGETRPIADNNTPAGRSRNRRVEFHIHQ